MGWDAPPEHYFDDEPTAAEALSQEAAKTEISHLRCAGLQAVSTSEAAPLRPLQACPASQDHNAQAMNYVDSFRH